MKIKSQIIPINIKDIDTDLIIPADYLKGISSVGLGKYLFKRLRDNDPNFPLNLKKYQQCQILVVEDNFGCGSSREHAAWALKDWGIKAIISSSFADIFKSNALKNGLILVELPKEVIKKIFQISKKDECVVEIDLAKQEVQLPNNKTHHFEIDPYRKECILKGLDDLGYLTSNMDVIVRFNKIHSKIFFNINH